MHHIIYGVCRQHSGEGWRAGASKRRELQTSSATAHRRGIHRIRAIDATNIGSATSSPSTSSSPSASAARSAVAKRPLVPARLKVLCRARLPNHQAGQIQRACTGAQISHSHEIGQDRRGDEAQGGRTEIMQWKKQYRVFRSPQKMSEIVPARIMERRSTTRPFSTNTILGLSSPKTGQA